MDTVVKYRGKVATTEDIEFIRRLIEENPHDSRWALSKKLCKAWNWVQPNGVLRDMVGRSFMLRIQEAGYIKLPSPRHPSRNDGVHHRKPPKVDIAGTP